MELVAFVIIGLIALDLLAYRYGTDSREGFGQTRSYRGATPPARSGAAFDLELARQLQQARRVHAGSAKDRGPVSSKPRHAPRSTSPRRGHLS